MGVDMGTSKLRQSVVVQQVALGILLFAMIFVASCQDQAPAPVNKRKLTTAVNGQDASGKNDPVAQNNAVNSIDGVTADLEALKAQVKAQNEKNAKDLADMKATMATLQDQMERSLLEIKIQSAKDRQTMQEELLALITNLQGDLMSLRSDVLQLAARQTALEAKVDAVKAELVSAIATSAAQLTADYSTKITGVQNVAAANLEAAKTAILGVIREKEKTAHEELLAFEKSADAKYATIDALTILSNQVTNGLAGLQSAINQTNVDVSNLSAATEVRFTILESVVEGVKTDLRTVSNLATFLQTNLNTYMKSTDEAIAAVNSKLTAFEETYASDNAQTQTALTDLQAKAKDFKDFILLATGQLADLAKNYEQLNQQQKDDYKKLADAVALLKNADADLNQKIAGVQGSIVDLQARMDRQERLAAENSERLKNLESNVSALGFSLDQVKQDMKNYAAQLGSLSQQVDKMAKDILGLMPAVAALESRFTELAREVAKLAPEFLSNEVIAAAAMCENGSPQEDRTALARSLSTSFGTDVEQLKNATARFAQVSWAVSTSIAGRLEPVSNTPYAQTLNERFKVELQTDCGDLFVYDSLASTYKGSEFFYVMSNELTIALLKGVRNSDVVHDAIFQKTAMSFASLNPLTQAIIDQVLPSFMPPGNEKDDKCTSRLRGLVTELLYKDTPAARSFKQQLTRPEMASGFQGLIAEVASLQAASSPVYGKTNTFWVTNFSKLDEPLKKACLERQAQFPASAAVSLNESNERAKSRALANEELRRNLNLFRSIAAASSDITVLQKFDVQEAALMQKLADSSNKQAQDIANLTNNAIFTYKLIAMLAMRMGAENLDIATAAAAAAQSLGGNWTLADVVTPRIFAVSHRYGWSVGNSPLRMTHGNITLPGLQGILNGLQYAVGAVHNGYAWGNTGNAAVLLNPSEKDPKKHTYYVNGWNARQFVYGGSSGQNGQPFAQLSYSDVATPSAPQGSNVAAAQNLTRLKEGDVPTSFPAGDLRRTNTALVLRIVGQNLSNLTIDVMNDLAPQALGSFVAHPDYPWDPKYRFVPSATDPGMNTYPYFNRQVISNMPLWQAAGTGGSSNLSMVYDVLIKDVSPLLSCTDPFRAILRAKYKDIAGVDQELMIQHRMHKFSPIVLSFSDEMLQTVHPFLANINFDLDGNGIPNRTGWISRKDAFLALDRNGNGKIDNGTELFGEATSLRAGPRAQNGYDAMADLDENHDGYLDEHDGMFRKLVVWFDRSQDGISQPTEIFKLTDIGITKLSVKYENVAENKKIQSAGMPEGNWVVYKSKFFGPEVCGKAGCSSYDVYFGNSETSPLVEVAKAH